MNYAGKHGYADIILSEWPGDAAIFEVCEAAIIQSNMTIESCTRKQFQPQGMTAIWILSESHFSLHTYPEHKYITIDCYTCGNEGRPQAAIQYVIDALKPRDYTDGLINRGMIDSTPPANQTELRSGMA